MCVCVCVQYVEENLKAAAVRLTPAELQEVRDIAESADLGEAGRYPAGMSDLLFVDTPELK